MAILEQVKPATDIKPGEVVLGNRIRMAFPASVRDSILPKTDEELIRRVRGDFKHTHLTKRDARIWVIGIVRQESQFWDKPEQQFARKRIAILFCIDDK